jgi:tetratricopeptide (TPR) repeat protein
VFESGWVRGLVLTSLLPGLREIRAPLISGYMWLTFFFLVFHGDFPSSSHPGEALKPLFELGDRLSAFGVATVASVAAYLVGSAAQELLKIVARLLPPVTPVYAEPGTHFSKVGRDDIRRFVEIKLEEVRSRLFQVALSPGERGVDEEPGTRKVERELPLIRTLLLGERPELVGEIDRLQAEADLRITVAVPLAALVLYLALAASGGWLVALLPAFLLFAQGYKRQVDAGNLIAKALRVGKANAPVLESLEASAEAALERTSLEEELGRKADDGNPMAAFRLGNLRASGEDLHGAVVSLKFAAEKGVVRAHAELGQVYERLENSGDAEQAYRDGVERGDRKASEFLAAFLGAAQRGEEALEAARMAPGAEEETAEEELAGDVAGSKSRAAQYRRGVEQGSSKAAINLGLLMERRGDMTAAIRAFDQATELDSKDAQGWIRLGRARRLQGEFTKSAWALDRALGLQRRLLGPDHLEVAQILNSLGVTLRTWGRYGDARRALEKARVIQEGQVGPDHPAVAPTLDNLGNVLNQIERHGVALNLHKRALAINERHLGAEDEQTARTLVNLGRTLTRLGNGERAQPMLERAFDVLRRTSGVGADVIASAMDALAITLCDLGERDRALDLEKRAISVARDALGSRHPQIAQMRAELGKMLLGLGRLDEADAALKEGIEMAKSFPEPNIAVVGLMLRVWAEVELARGQGEEALRHAREALQLQRRALGPTHGELVRSLDLLADIYDLQGNPHAMTEARELAQSMRGRVSVDQGAIDSIDADGFDFGPDQNRDRAVSG